MTSDIGEDGEERKQTRETQGEPRGRKSRKIKKYPNLFNIISIIGNIGCPDFQFFNVEAFAFGLSPKPPFLSMTKHGESHVFMRLLGPGWTPIQLKKFYEVPPSPSDPKLTDCSTTSKNHYIFN